MGAFLIHPPELTLSSARLLRFSGSLMFPPRRNFDGSTVLLLVRDDEAAVEEDFLPCL